MLAVLLLLADPGPPLPPPRLPAGLVREYTGTAEEVGRAVSNPFRKRYELELRLVVLAAHAGGADLALQSRVWPLSDPVVAGPAAALTGRDLPARGQPAVRLDLIRVDPRGRVTRLRTDPFAVGPAAVSEALPDGPADRLPVIETGLFVPLPGRPVHAGDTWADGETAWAVDGEAAWNGAAAAAVTATRKSPDFDRPANAVTGLRRIDALTVPPADGFAVALDRAVTRREGATTVGELRASYAQQSAGRLAGRLLADATAEAAAVCGFAAELANLSAQGSRADPAAVRRRLVRVQRHLDDRPGRTPFRETAEAVKRGLDGLAAK